MATIVLSAAGLALGTSLGGSVLGLSAAVIGRAAGATLGRVIDQRLLGAGSEAVETGRVDRFRLTGASEGATVQQVYGRMRVAGQVIWATKFLEDSETSGGGKGAPASPKVTEYSYAISIAVALCEGEIARVGRVWADGEEVAVTDLNMRLYRGTVDQQPDPKIAATEGAANTPAYRGLAYVVMEDLPLAQFGNRVPQFTFEVMRPSDAATPPALQDMSQQVQAVAMIPGTGEYSLATTPVYLEADNAETVAINMNTPSGRTDFSQSTTALAEELPKTGSALLVVSWFGDDLRCGSCDLRPKVEQNDVDPKAMPWQVSGLSRANAQTIAQAEGRPIYGGTPCDASVIEGIERLKFKGQRPVFYPFILMEQQSGNSLTDPWNGSGSQPALPWRGRITTSLAPTQDGSPDGTSTAEQEVAAFLGSCAPSDFAINGKSVEYSGLDAWGYRRFILHYAHLCAAAGGVSAFCIGSEMRGMTQIRGAGGSFPFVTALRQLAAEVRAILGTETKISYAADWSEYHGYQPAGTADKIFHLDPLWSDPNIDFIGIDNYMPLSDWRDGEDHADAAFGSIYNPAYLEANVTGGEGFDWYYKSPTARDAQRRTPITDGHGEPWVWRYKDLPNWWSNPHHNRIDGARAATPTDWVPESKPFWFTELGCAAIDKGTNQPNKFIDPKSSESQLPHYSNGMRDDLIQAQYIRAMTSHYAKSANNPLSSVFNGRMVAMDRAHVWAWDARPFPHFPAASTLWSDGANYARGHWLNGRASSRTLAGVVTEICARSGIDAVDTTELYGLVRGYAVADIGSARAALQPLILAYGIEVAERDGKLVFSNRTGRSDKIISIDHCAQDPAQDTAMTVTRAPKTEMTGRVQLEYIDSEADYEAGVSEAVHPDDRTLGVSRSTFPLALTRAEGARTVSRWITEARVAQDTATFALPPSQLDVGAGDVVTLQTPQVTGRFRIDRIEEAGLRLAEATRVDPEVYLPQQIPEQTASLKPYAATVPVDMLFMDLPLLTGDEIPHAPHVAAIARPWPGLVALYDAAQDSGYDFARLITRASHIGTLETSLAKGPVGCWDRQDVTVRLLRGALSSLSTEAVLAGGNTIAVGDGSPDHWEIIQAAEASPLGAGQFTLTRLLRGQAGSSGEMPDVWPAGSCVVVLNGTPAQISLSSAGRGTLRHFRYGPAKRPLGDSSYRHAAHAFAGNGLRPYPVAHLRASSQGADLQINWIRQTRIDGDDWSGVDVPLGEDRESYLLRIMQDGVIRREAILSDAQFTYDAAHQAAETGAAPFQVAVAQVSARYGPGPLVTLDVSP
ncbi:baseplate multidomain protein megatron [Yoonia sp. 208BN28-4]|uniref:baseplate multidomain protein megatron n=1 Tax=Yoonia sp. 208BN28-4 TaxID=3126505 RepID=UPI0030B6DB3F